ncbi:hypothetical protein DQ244_04360 [Blastococcus sp. TBT05-19]|uniref:hypothetical protein n=1 Tax=Blastococcus sp. TBT05-19 TaxID=2250581 RepID=UPI000DEAF421|nr:hypothetical protein [Blastococcus sp. TBT05-19]RBY94541.1 hypothetical protein DQ244_04360 [Blastococcus sp. TBT05-19]
MIAVRRALVVLALGIATVLAATLSASATFSKTVELPVPTSVTAITVTAPATVSATGRCTTTTSSYWNGWTTVYQTHYWYDATVTWSASTTPTTATGRVTGYRVMAHLNNGTSVSLGETDAATRTMSQRVDRAYLNYQPRVSIVTLTSYGWTTESPRSAVLTC